MNGDRRPNLNPVGRIRAKKHRSIVPVNDTLHGWLCDTDDWFVCNERTWFDEALQVELTEQIVVKSVRSGRDTMPAKMKLPDGRGPKLIRHCMAIELRKCRVDPWELADQLGHRVLITSEIYAIYDPDNLSMVEQTIFDVLSDLRRITGPALRSKLTQEHQGVAVLRA